MQCINALKNFFLTALVLTNRFALDRTQILFIRVTVSKPVNHHIDHINHHPRQLSLTALLASIKESRLTAHDTIWLCNFETGSHETYAPFTIRNLLNNSRLTFRYGSSSIYGCIRLPFDYVCSRCKLLHGFSPSVQILLSISSARVHP